MTLDWLTLDTAINWMTVFFAMGLLAMVVEIKGDDDDNA